MLSKIVFDHLHKKNIASMYAVTRWLRQSTVGIQNPEILPKVKNLSSGHAFKVWIIFRRPMTGIRFIFGHLKTRPLYHKLLIRKTKAFIQSSDQFLKTQSDLFNTYNNDIVSFQFLQFFPSSAIIFF